MIWSCSECSDRPKLTVPLRHPAQSPFTFQASNKALLRISEVKLGLSFFFLSSFQSPHFPPLPALEFLQCQRTLQKPKNKLGVVHRESPFQTIILSLVLWQIPLEYNGIKGPTFPFLPPQLRSCCSGTYWALNSWSRITSADLLWVHGGLRPTNTATVDILLAYIS